MAGTQFSTPGTAGCSRSPACRSLPEFAITCPYHDDRFWAQIKENNAVEWADAVAFDEAIRHGSARANADGHPLRAPSTCTRPAFPSRRRSYVPGPRAPVAGTARDAARGPARTPHRWPRHRRRRNRFSASRPARPPTRTAPWSAQPASQPRTSRPWAWRAWACGGSRVEAVLGGRLVWYAETDPHARTVLAHRSPVLRTSATSAPSTGRRSPRPRAA
jgi:hypothetical protein